ncbi:MAG: acyltransferase 3 [Frankiales bacterium]|nr:acyltransferase 3 [Frankiales bacterium]
MTAPAPTVGSEAAVPGDRGSAMRLHYLDGLRGWAALAVVVFHSTWESFKDYTPGVRTSAVGLVNDGKLAVYVFFVLSGLVLAHPYLRTGDLRVVQTTALRRYARLVIPIIGASLLALVMMRLGWLYNVQASQIVGSRGWLGSFYQQAPTIGSWAKFAFYNVFFHYDWAPSYDIVLWTMPYELAGSFLVFGMLALAGSSLKARLVWYAAMAVICFHEQPTLLSFVVGVALAEFAVSPFYRRIAHRPWGDVAGIALLAAAFTGSVLLRGVYSPKICAALALFVVASAVLSRLLRGLLQTRVSQFLGRVSFPLYLIHSLVICGPSAMLIIHLDHLGWSRHAVVATVAPFTIAASLLAAWLFSPVERLAIGVSHRLSDMILGSRAVAKAADPAP